MIWYDILLDHGFNLDLTLHHMHFLHCIALWLWSALSGGCRSMIGLDLSDEWRLLTFCMWEWTLQGKGQERELELESDESQAEIEAPLPLTVTSRVWYSYIYI